MDTPQFIRTDRPQPPTTTPTIKNAAFLILSLCVSQYSLIAILLFIFIGDTILISVHQIFTCKRNGGHKAAAYYCGNKLPHFCQIGPSIVYPVCADHEDVKPYAQHEKKGITADVFHRRASPSECRDLSSDAFQKITHFIQHQDHRPIPVNRIGVRTPITQPRARHPPTSFM